MTETTGWVPLATYSSGLEADAARMMLEDAGIPVVVRDNRAGLFGAAFQGFTPGGAEVFVPAAAVADARELLGLDE